MTRLPTLSLALLLLAAAALPAQDAVTRTHPVMQRAIEQIEAGDDAGAIATLEALRGDDKAPPQALALLGALYLESGRPYDALDVLQPLAEGRTPDAAVLYNAGRAGLAIGNLEMAARYLERSVRLRPDSPAARELGLLVGARGAFGEALALLAPWARAHPEDVEARLAAAVSAIQLERAPEAEEMLSDLPQDRPRVRLLWARLLLLKGDPWGALATLKPLIGNAPAEMDLDVRRAAAQAHTDVGQAAAAVEVLQGHQEGRPSVALQLAQAQYQSGDLAGAVATLRPFAAGLLEMQEREIPDRGLGARVMVEYGRYLSMSGEREQALPYLETATRLAPDSKQGWQMLGQTLAGLGRREEAQTALERFQEISKQEVSASDRDVQARQELDDPTLKTVRQVAQLVDERRFEEALGLLRQERALAPEDLRPLLIEAKVLMLLGRGDEALGAAEEAVRKVPGSPDALYVRGYVQMGRGNLPAAETDLRQTLAIQPDHLAAMNDLAVLLLDRGDEAEARALLERVLELNPSDEVAASNLRSLGGR